MIPKVGYGTSSSSVLIIQELKPKKYILVLIFDNIFLSHDQIVNQFDSLEYQPWVLGEVDFNRIVGHSFGAFIKSESTQHISCPL